MDADDPTHPGPETTDDEGSYTARPSKEVPEEGGRTRDEDDERVERTGTDSRPQPSPRRGAGL